MKKRNIKQYWLVIIVSLVCAFISANLNFQGLWLNAVPWGIILLIISFFLSKSRNDSMKLGGIFGFVVSYSYLWFDNRGIKSMHQVLILIPLVIVPALFGLCCGVVLGYIGWLSRQTIFKKFAK